MAAPADKPRSNSLKRASDAAIEAAELIAKNIKRQAQTQAKDNGCITAELINQLNETLDRIATLKKQQGDQVIALLQNRHDILGKLPKEQRVELLWNAVDMEPPKG